MGEEMKACQDKVKQMMKDYSSKDVISFNDIAGSCDIYATFFLISI